MDGGPVRGASVQTTAANDNCWNIITLVNDSSPRFNSPLSLLLCCVVPWSPFPRTMSPFSYYNLNDSLGALPVISRIPILGGPSQWAVLWNFIVQPCTFHFILWISLSPCPRVLVVVIRRFTFVRPTIGETQWSPTRNNTERSVRRHLASSNPDRFRPAFPSSRTIKGTGNVVTVSPLSSIVHGGPSTEKWLDYWRRSICKWNEIMDQGTRGWEGGWPWTSGPIK